MTFSIREWIHLALRWFHVFAGIMWVGQTYYFTWLDRQLGKLESEAASTNASPAVWMVHSGGFYSVEKRKSLGVLPESVHWFRWEALMTWLSGMVLLFLVYYFTGGLLDPDVANISQLAGVAIGLAVLAAGWHLYDLAVRSSLGKSQPAFRCIFAGDDGRDCLGTDACSQRTCHIYPCGCNVWDYHDGQCVVPDSTRAAQDDCCRGRRRKL